MYYQIIFCVVFRYFIPNANIKIYFDWHLLNKILAIKDPDNPIVNIKNIPSFKVHYIMDEDYNRKINDHLVLFRNSLLDICDKTNNTNSLEKFIMIYHVACTWNNDYKKTGEFFSYRFADEFMENGEHITNGFIGSLLRFFPLRQQEYEHEGKKISQCKHLVWRDSHATLTGIRDAEWIKELNKLCCNGGKYNNEELYLLFNSASKVQWHGFARSTLDNLVYKSSPLAGVIQICNSKIYENDLLYLTTIGIAFILSFDGTPILKNYRRLMSTRHGSNDSYSYGIDEYVLSGLYEMLYFRQKSIYLSCKMSKRIFMFHGNIDLFRQRDQVGVLMFKYLVDNGYIKSYEKISIAYFLLLLEKVRNNKKVDPYVGYLLHMIPNLYKSIVGLFNSGEYAEPKDFIEKKYSWQKIYNSILSRCDTGHLYNEINKENLLKLKLFPQIGVYYDSPMEWNQSFYLDYTLKNEHSEYDTADFYSGYYKERPPSLDIGILRCPSDLDYCIECLKKNKLVNVMNKSHYKMLLEKDDFYNELKKKGKD